MCGFCQFIGRLTASNGERWCAGDVFHLLQMMASIQTEKLHNAQCKR